MLSKSLCLLLFLGATVESGAIVKRSAHQVMDAKEMKQFAEYVASKFNLEEHKLHQLAGDLLDNLREVTEISDDVHDKEKHMLEKVKTELNDVINRQSRVTQKLRNLAFYTAQHSDILIGQFRELASRRQVTKYRQILDKMAEILNESHNTLESASSEIKVMSREMSEIMAPMGLFKAMIRKVKSNVDDRDSFGGWSKGVLMPIAEILAHMLKPGGILNDGKGDGGFDDAMEGLVQNLPKVLYVGQSISRIADTPYLVDRLNTIYHDFGRTQTELKEESDIIEAERSHIYKWKNEVRNLRSDYGNNLQELHMNDLIEDLLKDDVIPDFEQLKKASQHFYSN